MFSAVIISMTCPLILGAGAVSEKERIILLALSLLLFIFYFFRLREIFRFTLFLSIFLSIFLNSRFIFLKNIDISFFQAAALAFLFFKRKGRGLDNFSSGLICLAIAVFLLQFLINRLLLGFYLNLWIDIKNTFPVFLFCAAYLIMPLPGELSEERAKKWAAYFAGLFILASLFPPLPRLAEKGAVAKKTEPNLAFFYKDREKWKSMNSSFRRGLVYKYLGLWPRARNEFKKILVSSPEDIDTHFNLAQSYHAERLWYEAMLEYKRVVELDPRYPQSHYGLALVYKNLGEVKKAEEEFLRELDINPGEISAYLGLEEIYERQGLIKVMEKTRDERLRKITYSIDEKDIADDNLKMLPVILNGGAVTVEVVARGTYARGFWPRIEVWASSGGRLIRTGDAWIESDNWKSYYFRFRTMPGEEKLIVHFINDFYGGPGNDRNLYVKRINFMYGR